MTVPRFFCCNILRQLIKISGAGFIINTKREIVIEVEALRIFLPKNVMEVEVYMDSRGDWKITANYCASYWGSPTCTQQEGRVCRAGDHV